MFTGIVQNQGKVVQKKVLGGQIRFGFQFRANSRKGGVTPPLHVGESICVNGVCLTVASVRAGLRPAPTFFADVIDETLKSTTLGTFKIGNRVNLERSLKTGDPIGGHFVTGHVDGRGKILKLEKRGKNRTLTIQAPPDMRPYLALKGSIAVDGVSLTIQKVRGLKFQIGLVPHTLKVTTLGKKRTGDLVNLEADLLVRYLKVLGGIQ